MRHYYLTACNYSYMQLGLMDYNARFYSPTLGRFIQPDTIIPDLTNSQAWNRYSYTLNNPVKYIDPSGHDPEDLIDFIDGGQEWKENEKETILQAAEMTGQAIADVLNSTVVDPIIRQMEEMGILADFDLHFTSTTAFLYAFGGKVRAVRSSSTRNYAAEVTQSGREITYYNVNLWATDPETRRRDVYAVDNDWTAQYVGHSIHEFGHLLDNRTGNALRGDMTGDLTVPEDDLYRGFRGGRNDGRFNPSTASGEIWADMFQNWVRGKSFSFDSWGDVRENHMTSNMSEYILMAGQ